jgi:hypothetical protein
MNQQREQALAEQREQIMSRAERKIWVTFRKEGIHKYPAAATDPNLCTAGEYDVSFLANAHRHIFHFRVWIDVFHNDRDIEFIQFKRWLEGLYNKDILQLDFKSCEMISDDLYLQIAERYPDRAVWIEVAEDGENGALIKYEISHPNMSIKI